MMRPSILCSSVPFRMRAIYGPELIFLPDFISVRLSSDSSLHKIEIDKTFNGRNGRWLAGWHVTQLKAANKYACNILPLKHPIVRACPVASEG